MFEKTVFIKSNGLSKIAFNRKKVFTEKKKKKRLNYLKHPLRPDKDQWKKVNSD